MSQMAGTIYEVYRVACGGCGEEVELDSPTKPKAMIELERSGWHYTNLYGWICRACRRRQTQPERRRGAREEAYGLPS